MKMKSNIQDLIKSLPQGLKEVLFKQWDAKQNGQWHPEGNNLKHVLIVMKRAYKYYPEDVNMVMSALFHDLGKMDVYAINPKNNMPIAYGHADKSVDYVEQFSGWIESNDGASVNEIKYIVGNHMKVKSSVWNQMREQKKAVIMSHPSFDKLVAFSNKLDGGGVII